MGKALKSTSRATWYSFHLFPKQKNQPTWAVWNNVGWSKVAQLTFVLLWRCLLKWIFSEKTLIILDLKSSVTSKFTCFLFISLPAKSCCNNGVREWEKAGEKYIPPVMTDEQRNHQGNWKEIHLEVLKEAKNERALLSPRKCTDSFFLPPNVQCLANGNNYILENPQSLSWLQSNHDRRSHMSKMLHLDWEVRIRRQTW